MPPVVGNKCGMGFGLGAMHAGVMASKGEVERLALCCNGGGISPCYVGRNGRATSDSGVVVTSVAAAR